MAVNRNLDLPAQLGSGGSFGGAFKTTGPPGSSNQLARLGRAKLPAPPTARARLAAALARLPKSPRLP